jgi:cellulose synthase/poly-beta-1,6-N-acetylglucosamine synthase-like glycosyltransferase
VLDLIAWGVAVYFGVYLLVSLVFVGLAARATRSHDHIVPVSSSSQVVRMLPPISIVVAAHDESAVIVDTVRSLLTLEYPEIEVVVVNDGSRDVTIDVLRSEFELRLSSREPDALIEHEPVRAVYEPAAGFPLLVVDKEHGGRADALNAGIGYAASALVTVMDADEVLEHDALVQAVRPFAADPFRTVAVGATLGIANGCRIAAGRLVERRRPRRLLPLFQAIEYDRTFRVVRVARGAYGAVPIVSGGFGVFRRDLLLAVGGFDRGTLGEDLELTVRINRFCSDRGLPYRIVQLPATLCWTRVPDTLRVLHRQRRRWQRGLGQVLWRYRGMALRPRYGRVGLLALPALVLYEAIAPVLIVAVSALLVYGAVTGAVGLDLLLLVVLAAWVSGVAPTLAGLALTTSPAASAQGWGDLAAIVGAAFAEPFLYQPLTLWFRLESIVHPRRRVEWGEMEREAPQIP